MSAGLPAAPCYTDWTDRVYEAIQMLVLAIFPKRLEVSQSYPYKGHRLQTRGHFTQQNMVVLVTQQMFDKQLIFDRNKHLRAMRMSGKQYWDDYDGLGQSL